MSFIDHIWEYKWIMSNIDLDLAKKLGLTRVQNYWRDVTQIVIELNKINNLFLRLATFLRHLRKVYDNAEVSQNISIRKNMDLKLVLYFVV